MCSLLALKSKSLLNKAYSRVKVATTIDLKVPCKSSTALRQSCKIMKSRSGLEESSLIKARRSKNGISMSIIDESW